MKVFISWSGVRSRYIADALGEWLPDVIQAIEPFLSTNDIPKGTRWGAAVASELEGTSVGVVCLTPENLDSRWIHYEVGALSKMIAEARICTYLYELRPGQLLSPLADFQATTTDKEDTFKMLFSINAAQGGNGLSTEKLRKAFEKWWGVLEEKLTSVPKTEEVSKAPSIEESIQEMLRLLRTTASVAARPRLPSVDDVFGSSAPGRLQSEIAARVRSLSDRELQIFRFIGQGLSTVQIAGCLSLSPITVESHRNEIKRKISIQSSAELVRAALLWVRENG